MQVREKISLDLVEQYRRIFVEVGEDKCTCPPITVYLDGVGDRQRYVIADGHHRYRAAKAAGRATLRAYIREGTLDEGVIYAVQHNLRHGLQYTRADKQKIVTWFLDHPRYGQLSSRQIADMTGNLIPHSTVANIRKRRKMQELDESSNLDMGPADRLTPEQVARRRTRQLDRLRDAASMLLMGDEDAGVRPVLEPYVTAIREAIARYDAARERLEDDGTDDPDDQGDEN
jgi:hypothetical protein